MNKDVIISSLTPIAKCNNVTNAYCNELYLTKTEIKENIDDMKSELFQTHKIYYK